MRTLLLSILLGLFGLTILWIATDKGRAFTTDTARKVEVRDHPRKVPNFHLEDENGNPMSSNEWRGHYTIIDFIYTSCTDACLILGSGLKDLQTDFKESLTQNKLRLLSISFDPGRDTPQILKNHLSHFAANSSYWSAARPISTTENQAILDFFKIIVIPDKKGGFTHSAGYQLIDPEGRLIAIFSDDEYNHLHETLTGKGL
ncbi:SCO family protein [Candidatus Nitrosacidococcus tergens]|uniref:Cytochrome oxidase biogenesis protein SCO1/SenC n=1 Tax=Candidatus Nitrosacidococcus tergens TaxID=553981 RepID=A0A7G1Q7B7_9GAMM|nr:SCO family protein [Candidatus Nitrosacidococcus tergens]CAB1274377.1 Cytochrome oxidase biogenesis protein SCO1/SenC [Candidatus Nitrosacidococcus tergens]